MPVQRDTIDTWIFDLDNTLYPETSTLFDQINDRMNAYIGELLGFSEDEANTLRQGFYVEHGTTLNGLMQEYDADPVPFLAFVHEVDLSRIRPAPDLAVLLETLPGRRLVHTNGTTRHAERVLDRLGIADCFDGIFDIVGSEFEPKPKAGAFDRFIGQFDFDPSRAIMFEDKPDNLVVPHARGMTTVHIDWRTPHGALSEEVHIHHRSPAVETFLEALPKPVEGGGVTVDSAS